MGNEQREFLFAADDFCRGVLAECQTLRCYEDVLKQYLGSVDFSCNALHCSYVLGILGTVAGVDPALTTIAVTGYTARN